MRKIYSYAILLVACAISGSLAASAQSTTPTTWDVEVPLIADTTGITLRKYVSEKDSTNTFTLTLEAFATGNSVTSQREVVTPLDIVLVLDVSGSMNKSYTAITTSYTARDSQSYKYSTYGSNTYYYLHTDGKYYPVTQSTYTGTASYTELSSTSYTYNTYGTNAYYYYNESTKHFCLVTRGSDTIGSSEYTSKSGLSYSAVCSSTSNSTTYDQKTYYKSSYYYKPNNSNTYYEVWWRTKDSKYKLAYKSGDSITDIDKDWKWGSSTVTLYIKDSTTYYYLSFTDGGTTYYLTSDGKTSTTRPNVTSATGTLYTGVLYRNDAPVYYCLTYTVGSQTYYLTSNGSSTTKAGVSLTSDTIYTGVLYTQSKTSTATTKIAALKTAVESFINTVKVNAKTNSVNHRISIVIFGCYLEPSIGTVYWANKNWDNQYQTQVATDLLSVSDDKNCNKLINTVKGLTMDNGSTPSDWGLMLANCVFNGEIKYTDHKNNTSAYPTGYNSYNADGSYNDVNGTVTVTGDTLTRGHIDDKTGKLDDVNVLAGAKKLVVFFTDGQPYMDQNSGASGFKVTYRNVKDYAVEEAQNLKKNGAEIYSVAVVDDAEEKFTDNTSTSGKYSISQFLNFVSSNYPSSIKTMADGVNYKGTTDSKYYKLANGDLTDIFVSIAEEATTGGSKRQLSAETTTAIDYLTPDFDLPSGVKVSDIGVYVDSLVSRKPLTDTTQQYTFGGRKTLAEFNGKSGNYVQLDTVKNVISVTGFDYTKADTDAVNGPWGNWVGPRSVSGSTSTPLYRGRRLVITIPIRVAEDYEGGFDLPTNKGESGIYVIEKGDTTNINHYPVPKVDFPSIGIVKYGLKKGESVTYSIYQLSKYDKATKQYKTLLVGTPPYRAVLTATEDDVPAYAIIKDLPEGEYKVVENVGWSWTYDVTSIVVKTAKDSYRTSNQVSVEQQLLASDMVDAWPDPIDDIEHSKCVLFTFTNDKKKNTDGEETFDPTIYAESVVKNKFKGGKQTSATHTTTNSKTQP